MTTEINRQDLLDLRERVCKLETATAGLVVKIGVLASLISIAVPSVATILPTVLH